MATGESKKEIAQTISGLIAEDDHYRNLRAKIRAVLAPLLLRDSCAPKYSAMSLLAALHRLSDCSSQCSLARHSIRFIDGQEPKTEAIKPLGSLLRLTEDDALLIINNVVRLRGPRVNRVLRSYVDLNINEILPNWQRSETAIRNGAFNQHVESANMTNADIVDRTFIHNSSQLAEAFAHSFLSHVILHGMNNIGSKLGENGLLGWTSVCLVVAVLDADNKWEFCCVDLARGRTVPVILNRSVDLPSAKGIRSSNDHSKHRIELKSNTERFSVMFDLMPESFTGQLFDSFINHRMLLGAYGMNAHREINNPNSREFAELAAAMYEIMEHD
ncbi:hypothetical protein YOLOSWAG_287 [Erwinia phage vB_EamM_Yoloswag]|uniref:Uncharacterized protein n=1 Tax=Erwinia phage vB_EamM_Yoloswag TaxID=1958956 RepID=A0A1S6L3K3_9CAUD|nr:hypothetical protein HOR66_gp287 [Erwinia phage vB_EamM_Yoloswag]AQT28758.1 hypothetical protein YOLOSWAG_287 [Erwinia phage vB_EamM_Yoloswag]